MHVQVTAHTLLYANADVSQAGPNGEVIAFAGHWRQVTGHDPALLIFDSKLATRPSSPSSMTASSVHHPARPPPRHHQSPARQRLGTHDPGTGQEQDPPHQGARWRRRHPAATLLAYPRPIRLLAVTSLGHDQPTLLITNRPQLPAGHVIQSARSGYRTLRYQYA